jgi:thiol-disulfide isomerase/thioredoxin
MNRQLKPAQLLAAALLLLALAACEVEHEPLAQGDRAPPWSATSFAGEAVSFPELLNGKPTVLVFWATWCSYCKAFMPYLREIERDYGTDRINVLTINAKEDGTGNPAAYIAALDMPMIAVKDGDAIATAYDVEYIPGLMIIDADGIVAYRRAWTELPAGDTVANLWSIQVRSNLRQLLN